MYKRLSKVFISTISIFSVGLGTTQVYASENLSDSSSTNIKGSKLKTLRNKAIVTNEEQLLKALDNSNITEIIIEGNLTISNKLYLNENSKHIKLIVGSEKNRDSSLVINQGVEIDGKGKLTIVKANSHGKEAISFYKDKMLSNENNTVLKNLNIIGNKGQIFINNNVDNLILENINVQDGILFKNKTNEGQNLSKVNFINSNVTAEEKTSLNILKESLISDSSSIYLSGFVGKNSGESFGVIAIDNSGNVVEANKVIVDKHGNLKTLLTGLEPGTEYKIHIVKFNSENKNGNYFLSSPYWFKTLDFKSIVDSETTSGVKIKIIKQDISEKYYPLYLVLKYKGKEFKKVEINKNIKGPVVFNITGLMSGSEFSYEFLSYITGESDDPLVIDKGEFKTLGDGSKPETSNKEEIDKNPQESNSNTTNSSYDILENGVNALVEDTFIKINVNEDIKVHIKDAMEMKTNIQGVNAVFEKGKLVLENLIPGKKYTDIKVYIAKQDGKQIVLNVGEFTTSYKTSSLNNFVKGVYFNAFGRNPDEEGFYYWTSKLRTREIHPEVFVKNLLNELEFIKNRPTTESKIKGLYKVIVNRNSDKEGLEYWVNIYNEYIEKGYPGEFALNIVVNKMLGSKEFQNIIKVIRN